MILHLCVSSGVQFSSVAQSRPTLCNPMNRSTPGRPVHHQLLEFTQTHVCWFSDAIQTSHPLSSLLLLPSIFPSIRIFLNESALHIRWPKYWSFSFNISPDLNQIRYDYTVEVRNRSKGLDLIDRVLEDLWTEVSDIVQEAVIKTIPKKKKPKKAKWRRPYK